jgi:hypothetical protein
MLINRKMMEGEVEDGDDDDGENVKEGKYDKEAEDVEYKE